MSSTRTRPTSGPGASRHPRGRHADGPGEIPAKGWTEVLWRVYDEINKDRVMLIAAGVTYYILLAFVPGLTAFLSLYGLVADPATVAEHVGDLQGLVPGGALDILNEQLTRLASEGETTLGLTLLISVAIALWSANAGIKALFEAMNIAYDEVETRSFLKLNAVSLLFTFGAIVMMGLMLGVVIVLPTVLSFIGLGEGTEWLLRIAGFVALLLVLSLGIAALYRWGPDRASPKWRWITPGAILALLATIVVSALFSWYAANFGSYNATYGSLGALIGFMTWIWLTSILLIVGGELNSELEHQTARDSTTGAERPLGSRGAIMADTVAGLDETAAADSGLSGQEHRRGRREGRIEGRREGVAWGTLVVAVPAALLLTVLQRRAEKSGRW
ncbi:ribonuclease BN [Aureimonas sp. Leaf454]|uniref:YihY/virulence factor BrkB family protein n=1 Tax=Aureimonas sp. Leaf454 TaxID=1736381 RepID=UPI0006FFD88B|nr:YihY/virulence factor BrkB family protein [Aureimonas sp. Leaf454]KQT54507.1 ribonuclease BN [Aureimonas sp. Leaf454]